MTERAPVPLLPLALHEVAPLVRTGSSATESAMSF